MLGLRARAVLAGAAGAALLATLLAVAVFAAGHGHLHAQRERSVLRQATADAQVVRALLTRGPAAALAGVRPPAGTLVLLRQRESWSGAVPASGLLSGGGVLPGGGVSPGSGFLPGGAVPPEGGVPFGAGVVPGSGSRPGDGASSGAGALPGDGSRSGVLPESGAGFLAGGAALPGGVGPTAGLDVPSGDGVGRGVGLLVGPDALPAALHAPTGTSVETVEVGGLHYLAVAIPVAVDAVYYELAPLTEVRATLDSLRATLLACVAGAAGLGGLLGLWAGRGLARPLRRLAGTAATVAGGDLDARMAPSADPDLAPVVSSFNGMVDALRGRIERERRFVGDVSHELRSPLTTLLAGVDVLDRHAAALPERPRQALDLVSGEVRHLRRLLDDLLALAKADTGEPPTRFLLGELVAESLKRSGRDTAVLTVLRDGEVEGRRLALDRVVVNLVDNAERHGGGLRAVVVAAGADGVSLTVDDHGPGVPARDRDRVFERFTTTRPDSGSGLGLALVAETAAAHGGTARCGDRPGGGARFTVALPAAG